MRPLRLAILVFSLLSPALGQVADGTNAKRFDYQSDVARLRKIVINSLYSHRDVFLRELISNANDALEKFRITSLTDKTTVNDPLNITIKLIPGEGGKGGRVVITDAGIGMSHDELANNLGTLAKSGTSEFLDKAEKDTSGNTGSNLIGQFGVGFYSSFLVADRVYVASIPHPSKANPNPVQHVFSSSSDDSSFEVYPDPRGNTLGRGTEITMDLKPDALEFLDHEKIKALVEKHSAFSSTYPIYLFEQRTEEVPDPSYVPPAEEESKEEEAETTSETEPAKEKTEDDEEPIVEDVSDEKEKEAKKEPEKPVIPMVNVTTDHWVHLNDQPPLWTRDPKTVDKEEYNLFFRSAFKDHNNPMALHHFKGDSGSGTSFKAILFIPPALGQEFWQSPKPDTKGVKLMVKRVFITSDLGDDALPKWVSWLRAIVDADDLPLNVSRETLQSTRFLSQVKKVLVKRLIQLLERIAKDDTPLYKKIYESYGATFKLGAMDNTKDRMKLAGLARWDTNLRNFTSLEEYAANRKKGQTQIFFLAGVGQQPQELAKSVFAEKLHARGYEVLLFTDPMDEMLVSNLRSWKGMQFQDAAKKGLKFGDEDEDSEDEKKEQEHLKEKFQPLIKWLKDEAKETVLDVIISNRLVASPCAVVADMWGYSANMERLMAAQAGKQDEKMLHEWAKKQKFLEINPRSPLIEGLLRKLEEVTPAEGEEKDEEAENELKEAVSIMIDSALVRSGYPVADSNEFFSRMDRVLRRSLGVSETAKAEVKIAPAPPVESGPLPEEATPAPESTETKLDEDENLDKLNNDEAPPPIKLGGPGGRKDPDMSNMMKINVEDFMTADEKAEADKKAQEEREKTENKEKDYEIVLEEIPDDEEIDLGNAGGKPHDEL